MPVSIYPIKIIYIITFLVKESCIKQPIRYFKYHYKKGEEGSLLHVTDIDLSASLELKLDDPQVQQDFKNYKALFPTIYLNRCV